MAGLNSAFRLIAQHFGWEQKTYLGYLSSKPEYVAARAARAAEEKEEEGGDVHPVSGSEPGLVHRDAGPVGGAG